MSPRKTDSRVVYQVIESPYTAGHTEIGKASLFFSDDTRQSFLIETKVNFFGDYLIDSQSQTSMKLVHSGQSASLLGRAFLYAYTLGWYALWDPALRKKRPEKLLLEVDDKLVATAYIP